MHIFFALIVLYFIIETINVIVQGSEESSAKHRAEFGSYKKIDIKPVSPQRSEKFDFSKPLTNDNNLHGADFHY